ncbi:PREDICTED: trihelix transcription factor GT-2-like, partial [Tarenaya hassleriana]|uniref:trihelix transcription factor GT-2-like n=1 Tax=Tarenaya hassleriana TaxID=28532 RepID=UPI0008FD3882
GSGHKLTNPYNFARNVPSLNLFSSSTSSSTASEEEEEGKRLRKRRRYWKGLLKRLTNDLMEKQEEMQKRFLETLEKREKERIEREQAWRVQETARINREYEIIAHERSASAAKDAAIISFLQKVSRQQQQQQHLQKQKHTQQQTREDHSLAFLNDQKHETRIVEAASKTSNSDSSYMLSPSSSRWPRDEVEALIRLRTNVEANYQENGTKGSLWEEISTGMQSLGYSRSAKRCKEKWENINKYFKKVKESNKKRPVDSKTCPYFHQLEAIHKEKNTNPTLPLMAAPQQLLLLPQETIDEPDKHKMGDEEGDKEEDEEEGDNETGGFETVLNKTCSPVDINNNVFA